MLVYLANIVPEHLGYCLPVMIPELVVDVLKPLSPGRLLPCGSPVFIQKVEQQLNAGPEVSWELRNSLGSPLEAVAVSLRAGYVRVLAGGFLY